VAASRAVVVNAAAVSKVVANKVASKGGEGSKAAIAAVESGEELAAG
jgi:hypothetical protein